MIPWLRPGAAPRFPPTGLALDEPNGLLAAGGELSAAWLLAAYRRGIFPWYGNDQPILWWSPDPRMVLFPGEFKLSRSLARRLRQGRLASGPYQVRLDTAFAEVMAACADMPRPGQDGTWIVPAIHRAYGELHELGRAHSVEVWVEERLVGGLYGVAIGRMFYGESMFSRESDASKVALAHLVRFLHSHRFGLIDCQMRTPHLASLGAREIPRGEFEAWLAELTGAPEAYPDGLWPADGARLPPQSPWQD
ncbi:leucyl/phenylalanyl-tRNA--protein transferase [Oryzomicrobium sp.]|uniref:leucyl/phenylalanyl-tRNA--protein transferase n=1 Tax=Oryzomicrobium sp. TaxID=1911578 RepID=UPI0025CC3057|nr:leucyl/phenylalanyl-tRNA--protein transferase [Oryzomicrobium sp.]MCE1242579.1 leucyl/phenylalanyl-tRNA--protein transferase [Oryzomicrobium sp.]